jgi:cilia- and flagella-associated protein 57
MAAQNEEDIDSEIQVVSSRYEKKLRVEREEGARLKGENGIMRKKFNTLNKDIEDNKSEIQRMIDDEKKLRTVIGVLEKEISAFKKDVSYGFQSYNIDFFWFRWLNEMNLFRIKKGGCMI